MRVIHVPSQVQGLVNFLRVAPHYVVPCYDEVSLYWERDIDATTEELQQVRQLLRILASLRTVRKLSLQLPHNTSPDVLSGFIFSDLKHVVYSGPTSAFQPFLHAHGSLDIISIIGPSSYPPAIIGAFRPLPTPSRIAPLASVHTLACPVGCLKGLQFPLSRLQALFLELKYGDIEVSEVCVSDTLQHLSPAAFPCCYLTEPLALEVQCNLVAPYLPVIRGATGPSGRQLWDS
ncbi:uncharacterized protein BXZ73DRAFT_111750 [Epithele typhae]|uniref:uncharacterized protein n=1 Tax=Epithele typhae TaxID=378194 RepID=UPI002008DFF8|nr:uncharacterized protein BXZ73DRAFT_111750 [Epithele typhae]KAH9897346.1 hypothetical protein BXZ73DRAFT_111750 [Epithele typhae]